MLQLLLTVRATLALYDGDSFVKTAHDFSDIGPQGNTFVALEFYAGWCGHCQAFAPIWKQAARHACAAAPQLEFVAVDCASDFLLCQEMRVASFPTIRLFGPGLPTRGRELSTCLHGCKTSAVALDEVLTLVRGMAPSAVPARSAADLVLLSERSACAQAADRPAAPLAVRSSGLRQGEAPPAAAQARWPEPPPPPPPPPPPASASPSASPSAFPSAIFVARPDLQPPSALGPRQMPVPLADLTSAVLYGLQREVRRLRLEPQTSRPAPTLLLTPIAARTID